MHVISILKQSAGFRPLNICEHVECIFIICTICNWQLRYLFIAAPPDAVYV